jgi:hypothetical protein
MINRITPLLLFVGLFYYSCSPPKNKPQLANKTVRVEEKSSGLGNDYKYIRNQIDSGKNVRLVIVLGKVDNYLSHTVPSEFHENWVRAQKFQFQTNWENAYLNAFSNYGDKFSIVDRLQVENNIEEMKLSKSGIISENSAIELGKMIGATHILYCHLSRAGESMAKNFEQYIDFVFTRLIDIESGTVVASIVDANATKLY